LEGEWNALGGGLVSDDFNWVGNAAPDGPGAHARFLGAAQTDAEVDIDGVFYTLGKLTFDNSNSYTLSGESLRLQDTTTAEANILSGSHEIASAVTLGSNLRKIGNGTLTLSGAIDWSGNSIEVAGGTLRLPRIAAGNNVTVFNGTAALIPGGDTSQVANVTIAGGNTPTGTLDVTDNAAVLDYSAASPAATVRAQLIAGRGGPGFGAAWTGQGITSSTAAAANATDPEARSVGYAENATLPLGSYATFRGETVDDSSILMAFTRTGDANLDGVVNDDDVTIVSATYAPGVPNAQWALGDFDYNGFVDDDDVTLLGVFYDPSATPIAAPALAAGQVAAVPEPSGIVLAIACGAMLMFLVPRLRLGTH
jgi:autotransporter-associated beta strand protein